jgi:uncharacterized protein (TIGR03790 family)
LNVLVVANSASSNSLELANLYCERRGVPPENLLRIHWPGGNVQWSLADFQSALLNPLQSAIAERGLSNQIDFVLLSMDIPYRVFAADGANATTSVLFYGFKADTTPPAGTPDSCSLPPNSVNSYAASERIFRFARPSTATNGSFLAMMLTGASLEEAKAVLERAVTSDGSFPTNTVLLQKTTDGPRKVRYALFDNAILNCRLREGFSITRTEDDITLGRTNLLGMQTGLTGFELSPDAFVPGGLADNLTSYGGELFVFTGQTNLLAFLRAGAAASYGTVIEPCNYLQKFPDPQSYFFQARGFTVAESYYQSVTNPYQGLLVGEPLAAPFASPGSLQWLNPASNAVLVGTTNLMLQLNADARRPLQRVELFLDGKFLQTVTNPPPSQGNALTVTLNGQTTTYNVPANATISSVVSNLVNQLNANPFHLLTKVDAFARGDRIELRSTDTNKAGAQVTLSVSNGIGSGAALTTFLSAARTNFLDSEAFGLRSYIVTGTAPSGSVLSVTITKTNGATVTLASTNTTGLTLGGLALDLALKINFATALHPPDGLLVEDFGDFGAQVVFNLRARAPGWPAARIRADFNASGGPAVTPGTNLALDEQAGDLQPRNHLYVSAGFTNATLAFPLITTNLSDGFHELTAVAYEGTHVWTQTRATVPVWIQNTALTANLALSNAAPEMAVESTLPISVTANLTNIALVELFSTGGRIAAVTNQAGAVFHVAGSLLGAGRHSFHAIVTAADGQKFRTTNVTTRLVGPEREIPLQVLAAAPPLLQWPGVVGRFYDVLSSDSLSGTFDLRDTMSSTNPAGTFWTDPAGATNLSQRFYKVRVSP